MKKKRRIDNTIGARRVSAPSFYSAIKMKMRAKRLGARLAGNMPKPPFIAVIERKTPDDICLAAFALKNAVFAEEWFEFFKEEKKRLRGIPVRGDLSDTRVIDMVKNVLSRGKSVIVYPENGLDALINAANAPVYAIDINDNMEISAREYTGEFPSREKYIKSSRKLNWYIWKCPLCGAEFKTEMSGNSLRCRACGKDIDISSLSSLLGAERKSITDETLKVHAALGRMPEYTYLREGRTSKWVGEGDLFLSREGLKYEGTPEDIFIPMEKLNLRVRYDDVTAIYIYAGGEYFEFSPASPCTIKWKMAFEALKGKI